MKRKYDILNALASRLKSPIIARTMSISSRTYAANAAHWFYSDNITIPAITGYTPIGFVGAGQNSGGLITVPYLIAPNRVAGFARNITSADISIEINLNVLYMRNELL